MGKYTAVKPNTAAEIFEKYRPHGILISDDTVTKGVSLIDFLSIVKMRYGYMRIILCAVTIAVSTSMRRLYIL